MKKLLCTMPCALWMGLVLLFVTACSDDDNNTSQIKVADESELEQTCLETSRRAPSRS